MKVLVAGASGLLGSALCRALETDGHIVYTLTRSPNPSHQKAIPWDPKKGDLDLNAIEIFDAVVNLAGENISSWRWTTAKKKAILESRTSTTALLCSALIKLASPPKVLINASAIGYYGSRGEELLDESSSSGTGFLAQVCRSWEAAAESAKNAGVRVVFLRTGVVLSCEGGALKQMLLPFKLGLGGRIGSGQQYLSWIAINDLVGIILFCLKEASLEGPVNAVAPAPVTNAELTKALGAVLRRPTFLPMPETLVRLAFGEMGKELLLSSTRAKPKKLLANGYVFLFPELTEALKFLLNKSSANAKSTK